MKKELHKILFLTNDLEGSSHYEKEVFNNQFLIEIYSLSTVKNFDLLFQELQPQLILADFNSLTKFNAVETLLKAIKREEAVLPCILLIDKESEFLVLQLLDKGVTDYVFKDRPFKLPVMVNKCLSHEEKKFRTLVENSSDATLILTPEGVHSYVSPAIQKILGYTQKEILEIDLFELLDSKEKNKVQEAMAIVLELPGVTGQSIDVCAYKKTGERICLEVTFSNLLHVSDIHGIALNLRDITEYKCAQNAILESEEKYRSFFENSLDGVLVTMTDGKILAANPAACHMFQMTEEEICEMGRLQLVDVTDPRVRAAIKERKRTGRVTAEVTMKRKDGSTFPGELTSSVYTDSHGENRTSMIIRDLSENKRMTEEKNFQADLLDKIGQAVYATDTSGAINYWNQTASRIFGWRRDEALGKNILNLTSSPSLKKTCSYIKDTLKKGKAWSGEINAIRKDGEEFPAYVTETPVYDSKGELTGYLVISSDITAQKKSENQLRELNSNLEKYTVELINANKGLEQYSFIVSHNLRAPVANLLGLKDLYLQEGHPEELKQRFLSELFGNINRLDKIITDLNNILKSKTEISEKKENVNFQELVNCVTESIKHLMIKEKVVLATDFSEIPEWITVKGYMHSIFYNLIFNSIKYRKPDQNPKIHIRSWREENYFYLSFKDNGLGIDLENKRDQLFRLYKRFHHHVEGKGMGLFMVKTQVEMLGGKISVNSEINNGTEFILRFKADEVKYRIENEEAGTVYSS